MICKNILPIQLHECLTYSNYDNVLRVVLPRIPIYKVHRLITSIGISTTSTNYNCEYDLRQIL